MTKGGPAVIAVSGRKKSGKSTLIEGLLPLLRGRGLRVAVIKHDGHSFSADVPGTDTWRHLRAGACGAAVFDGEKFMITRMESVSEEQLIPSFADADLILLEGFKRSAWPKIETVPRGGRPVCEAGSLVGIVGEGPFPDAGVPVVPPGDHEAAVRLILDFMGLP
ncbi:MAG: molybdopterin-guanine dinucleotide biosynthesis protein B [Clostridiales Family XIII bacterium]|nr:molybdopterin-guanine dinucleotide biosynthesis protein B [Clostridiales Family XIII bacterium]